MYMNNICSSCAYESSTNAKFCLKCGSTMTAQVISEPPAEVSTTNISVPPTTGANLTEGTSFSTTVSIPPSANSPSQTSVSSSPTSTGQTQQQPFGSVTVTFNPPPPPPPPPPPASIKPATAQTTSSQSTNESTSNQTPSSSKSGLLVFGAIAAVLVGVAFLFLGNSGTPQPAVPSQNGAPKTSEEALSAKDHLNQLLGLVRDSRWNEVGTKLNQIKSMSQIKAGDQKNSSDLTSSADQLLKDGQVQDAYNQFEKAVSADPRNVAARFGMGTCLTRLGKFDSAITVLVDAILISPDKGAGWLAASEAFSELGKDEAAASSLKLAIYLANNREAAMKFLNAANENVQSPKFKKVIESTLPALSGVPKK